METFEEETVKVPFGAKCLDAALCVPAAVTDTHTAVMLTHGAGGDMNFSQLVSLAHQLASHGFLCLRFTCKGLNLAYRLKAYAAVWDYVKSLQRFTVKRVFLGAVSEAERLGLTGKVSSRSMGCRAAAALARRLSEESEAAVEGVICLSFPLHPPGQTCAHRQRSEDLRALPAHTRVLFVSGTEDDMCDRVYFDTTVKEMKAQVEILWLRGGSHGLKVKGRSEESVMEEVNLKVVSWIRNQVAQAP